LFFLIKGISFLNLATYLVLHSRLRLKEIVSVAVVVVNSRAAAWVVITLLAGVRKGNALGWKSLTENSGSLKDESSSLEICISVESSGAICDGWSSTVVLAASELSFVVIALEFECVTIEVVVSLNTTGMSVLDVEDPSVASVIVSSFSSIRKNFLFLSVFSITTVFVSPSVDIDSNSLAFFERSISGCEGCISARYVARGRIRDRTSLGVNRDID
jgi:hypothetical protein